MLLKIVLCLSELASVAAQWVTFWWKEVVRVTINIELVRVGLVISVDQEHGTGVNHIVSVAATNPGIQVCYTAVFVNAQ
jgi:hypothetical protein